MERGLGPVAFGRKHQMDLPGPRTLASTRTTRRVGEVIDDESRRLIAEAYARATAILQQESGPLDRLAQELMGQRNARTARAPATIFQAA